jgi:hypothetical protein
METGVAVQRDFAMRTLLFLYLFDSGYIAVCNEL